MTKQSIEIKRLLHECNIDMGTFGLIELELLELERQAQTNAHDGSCEYCKSYPSILSDWMSEKHNYCAFCGRKLSLR